jgi:hypothetical protein
MAREPVESGLVAAGDSVAAAVGEQLKRTQLVELALVSVRKQLEGRRILGPFDVLDETLVRIDDVLEGDSLPGLHGVPRFPGQLLRPPWVRLGERDEVVERVLIGGLAGRFELEVEVLPEICRRYRR